MTPSSGCCLDGVHLGFTKRGTQLPSTRPQQHFERAQVPTSFGIAPRPADSCGLLWSSPNWTQDTLGQLTWRLPLPALVCLPRFVPAGPALPPWGFQVLGVPDGDSRVQNIHTHTHTHTQTQGQYSRRKYIAAAPEAKPSQAATYLQSVNTFASRGLLIVACPACQTQKQAMQQFTPPLSKQDL